MLLILHEFFKVEHLAERGETQKMQKRETQKMQKRGTQKMKRKKSILIYIFVVILGLLIFLFVILNERNQESPVERYIKEQNSESTKNLDFDTVGLLAEEEISQEEEKNKFTYQQMEYEFVSYEIMEDTDIATQTKYDRAYFYSGELPNPNELEEYRDIEAIKAESPELKDLWENNDKYTNEESAEIFNNNIAIINKYTGMVHIKTHYVFINCHLTNTSDKARNVYMNEMRFVLSAPDMEQFRIHDSMCYFDAATHTQGDDRVHSFFCYTLQPGETLNCIIGFQAKEEIDNQQYYFGFTDGQMEERGENPIRGKYMIKLSDLEETGK